MFVLQTPVVSRPCCSTKLQGMERSTPETWARQRWVWVDEVMKFHIAVLDGDGGDDGGCDEAGHENKKVSHCPSEQNMVLHGLLYFAVSSCSGCDWRRHPKALTCSVCLSLQSMPRTNATRSGPSSSADKVINASIWGHLRPTSPHASFKILQTAALKTKPRNNYYLAAKLDTSITGLECPGVFSKHHLSPITRKTWKTIVWWWWISKKMLHIVDEHPFSQLQHHECSCPHIGGEPMVADGSSPQVLRWMGYSSSFNVQLMLVSEVPLALQLRRMGHQKRRHLKHPAKPRCFQ